MQRWSGLIFAGLAALSAAGCSTTGATNTQAAGGYDAFLAENTPLIRLQIVCVKDQAKGIGMSNRVDDANTIAQVAMTRCRGEIQAVETAMTSYFSGSFAEEMVAQNRSTLTEIAVADIVRVRS